MRISPPSICILFCTTLVLTALLLFANISPRLDKLVHVADTNLPSTIAYHLSNRLVHKRPLMFLTPRPDGFNNQLITVAESIRCALLSNRTLVLPLMYANRRYDTETHGPFSFEDYFDLQSLRRLLPVVTIDQIRHARPTPCRRIVYATSSHSDSSESSAGSLLEHYRRLLRLDLKYVESFGGHKNERCVDDSLCANINFSSDEHFGVYSDYARFGQGYNINNSSALQSIKAALKPSAVVLSIADIMRASIGQRYNAMHIRRGDFETKCEQMKELCARFGADSFVQSTDAMVARMGAFRNRSIPIYISTTHANECRALLKGSAFALKFQDAVLLPDALKWAAHRVDMMALASQIVASRAEQFVGNRYSSFTTEINNMRFFLNKTERRLFF